MCRFAHVCVKSNRGGNEWRQVFFKNAKMKILLRSWQNISIYYIIFFFIRKEWIDNNINKHVWTTIVTLDKRKNKIKYQYYSSWELFNPKHCSFPDLFFFSSFCYGMRYPIIKCRSRSRVDYLFTEENCDTTWWRVYNKYV